MTLYELTMSVGLHAAAHLEILKSRLGDTTEDREREGTPPCSCSMTLVYRRHWQSCPWADADAPA